MLHSSTGSGSSTQKEKKPGLGERRLKSERKESTADKGEQTQRDEKNLDTEQRRTERIEGKKGKKGKKRTVPGRCSGGEQMQRRREVAQQAVVREESTAAEEKQRREGTNGASRRERERERERERRGFECGQQKRERKCSGRGLGFHRGSTAVFFKKKFSKSVEIKFQKAQKAHASRPSPRRKKARLGGLFEWAAPTPTEAQLTAPRRACLNLLNY